MQISIENIEIHYDMSGTGPPIILLHGWGANRFTFTRLAKHLEENFTVYTIDLPGFGDSVIDIPYSVNDVAYILHDFVVNLDIVSPIILGHSYGGRVAIAYASMYDVAKLILVDSAGIKKKLSLRKKLSVFTYKIVKRFRKNMKWGSSDYKQASTLMKKMLVMTVNTDLTSKMKLINTPTLLIYGRNDSITTLAEGYTIQKNIRNSSLVVMEDCEHFPYLERPSYFEIVLDAFILGADSD